MKKILLLATLIISTVICTQSQTLSDRATQVIHEKQPIADQGNGYYMNPIIAGNYGDPSLVRVGTDYYMAFSRSNGFIIWHSRDLINWEPVVKHLLPNEYSKVWAVDLQYFDGKFHLYMPIGVYPGANKLNVFGNFVVTAENAEGPWSELISVDIPIPDNDPAYSSIDPGFIQTPGGEKYLYVNHGYVVKLDKTGTKAVGKSMMVYEGWPIPAGWNVECMCLESPKLFIKDGFYYLVSAQGGTSGPSTAHMTVVARSKSPLGPWVNSPYNPVTHTYSSDEKWWHQGHGTIFEAVDGSWWTVYHARLNNYVEIGRQTLLMPIEWTADGWPVVKGGMQSHELIPAPKGENVGHGMVLSDGFDGEKPGIQWEYDITMPNAFVCNQSRLIMKASGNNKNSASGSQLQLGAVNKSFEVIIEVEISDSAVAAGIAVGNDGIQTNGFDVRFTDAPFWRMRDNQYPTKSTKVFLKIKNWRKDLSFYYSHDGENWLQFNSGLRLTGSGIRLFAAGNGEAIFHNFYYRGLE
jgi:xylan 1,4-beta-xylosidase